MNKHYIRINSDKDIICGYSDVFENYTTGDICINSDSNRHFELLEEINPMLINLDGIYLYKYDNNEVIKKSAITLKLTLEIYKNNKINKIDILCNQEILNGFHSTALNGVDSYLYGFDEQDQSNFTQELLMILSGQITSVYWKTKGIDGFVAEYTIDQFKKLISDAQEHKTTLVQKYWKLKTQILSCETYEEVDAISW